MSVCGRDVARVAIDGFAVMYVCNVFRMDGIGLYGLYVRYEHDIHLTIHISPFHDGCRRVTLEVLYVLMNISKAHSAVQRACMHPRTEDRRCDDMYLLICECLYWYTHDEQHNVQHRGPCPLRTEWPDVVARGLSGWTWTWTWKWTWR